MNSRTSANHEIGRGFFVFRSIPTGFRQHRTNDYSLIGLGCIVFGLSSDIVSFFLGMAVFTLGEIIALPIGMAYSSNLAPESMRGRYFGFRGMTWALSGFGRPCRRMALRPAWVKLVVQLESNPSTRRGLFRKKGLTIQYSGWHFLSIRDILG